LISLLHIDTGLLYRGGQRQVDLLIHKLAEYEIKQYLACPDDSPLIKKSDDIIVKRISIPKSNFKRFFSGEKVRRFLRENGIDIMHAHDSHAHTLAVTVREKNNPVQLIVTRRSSGRIGFGSKTKYLTDHIHYIAISRHVKEMLIQGGVNCERIELIPSMIDLDRFDTVRKNRLSSGAINKKFKIISASAFDPEKGVFDAVKAIQNLSKRRNDFVYYAYGDGPEMKRISNYIIENKLTDLIKLPGWQKEPLEYLNDADLFISPSYREGLNSSIIEAMAAGVPVVASSLEPHKENISPGLTGLLFPPGDIEEIANQIDNLLNNPELAEKIISNAGKVALKFNCKKITGAIYDLYLQVIAQTN